MTKKNTLKFFDGVDYRTVYPFPSATDSTQGIVRLSNNTINFPADSAISAKAIKDIFLEGENTDIHLKPSIFPSSLNNIIEFDGTPVEGSTEINFPSNGESQKIYIDTHSNQSYRWDGNEFIELAAPLDLGENAGQAYEGSKGAQLRLDLNEHIANKDNPHSVTINQLLSTEHPLPIDLGGTGCSDMNAFVKMLTEVKIGIEPPSQQDVEDGVKIYIQEL